VWEWSGSESVESPISEKTLRVERCGSDIYYNAFILKNMKNAELVA
jgi:hypothetical protein